MVAAYFKTGRKFLLLLVDYTEAEVNFIGLFKVGLHAHHLRKSFLGMLKRSIAVVQDADTVPKLRLLLQTVSSRVKLHGKKTYFRILQVIEGLLVG